MNAFTPIRARQRMLGAAEEMSLFLRHRDGDEAATHALVDAHMPLIQKIAGRYSRFGTNHADIVQEAVLGFVQGLNHYDPDRGFRVSTLCRWWSRAAVADWIRANHSLVKLGTTAVQKKLFGSLKHAMARNGVYDAVPSERQLEVLAKELSIPASDIRDMAMRMSSGAETSTDAPIRGMDGNGFTRLDQMADESADVSTLEDRMDDRRRRQALVGALDGLDARKRDIIERRYLADEAETLEDLSLTHGVTRERIRQLEVQAIEQLGLSLPAMLSTMAGQERRSSTRR